MGITDTYRAVFNGYVSLVRAMNGGTTQYLLKTPERPDEQVAPAQETRTPQFTPRQTAPRYDGRCARSHCNKNIGYKSANAR